MSKLTSHPHILWNTTLPFVYWDDFFPEGDLQKIEKYCKDSGVEKSTIVSDNDHKINETIRDSDIKFHYINPENEWIFNKLLNVAELINDNFYKFDLLGFNHFQYTEYNKPGATYDYHPDMLMGVNVPQGLELTRKLSFSLILSDTSEYQGGDFEMKLSSSPADKLEQKRGRIIAFPSYLMHRVSPIISGCRRSIVFWAVGPRFK